MKAYGLVRDKYGRPKIDGDPNDLHPAIKALLTPDERKALGIKEDDNGCHPDDRRP